MSELTIDLRGTTPSVKSDFKVNMPITDLQAKDFGIQDIRNLVKTYYRRKEPNLAWLRPKAMWYGEDMYAKYAYKKIYPAEIVFEFSRANLIDKKAYPEVLQTTHLENRSNKRGTFRADLSIEKNVTVSNTSSSSSSFTIGVEGGFKVKVFTVKASFSYTYVFGESHTESQSVTLGTSCGASVELDPGQKVEVQLVSTRMKQKVEVVYRAHIQGNFTLAYNDKYDFNNDNNRHNIWFPAVPNWSKEIKDTFEADTYGESKVVVVDTNTGLEIAAFPLSSEQMNGTEPIMLTCCSCGQKIEAGE